MPSPFPGMNPYLEKPSVWPDFHNSFLLELRKRLVRELKGRFTTRLEAHLFIHELSSEERRPFGLSDVSTSESYQPRANVPGRSADVLEAPFYFSFPSVDEVTVPFLEIRDVESHVVVTVIELLSPTNKYSGPDRETYLKKRTLLIHQNVNLVEVDLLRGGPHMPNPGMPDCVYSVMVRRVTDWKRVGLWPMELRDRLPRIPIPIQEPTPDVKIDLQDVLDTVYDESDYHATIYRSPPVPALKKEEIAWANECLREANVLR